MAKKTPRVNPKLYQAEIEVRENCNFLVRLLNAIFRRNKNREEKKKGKGR